MRTWRYFWRLMRFRPRYYATDITMATLYFSLMTVTGLILRAFFNGLTGEPGRVLAVWPAISLQALHGMLSAVALFAAVLAITDFQQHGMALLIRNMVAHILKLPSGRALPAGEDGVPLSTGKAISTLRDDVSETLDTIVIFDDLIAIGATAAIAFAIMFSVNPQVTVGAYVPLLLVIAVAQRLAGLARRYRQQSREATSRVTEMIADMFHAAQAIKAAAAEERIVNRFRELNDRRRQLMVRDKLLTQVIDAMSNGIVDVGVGVVLLTAASSFASREFTVGDFALFASYIWPATHLIRVSGQLITRYQQVNVSVRRMESMMQGLPAGAVVAHNPVYLRQAPPPAGTIARTAAEPLQTLEVKGLTYHHPDGARGIESVDFALERGTITVVTGRIGSGKSTLLQVLLGILPAESGTILWNGKPVADATTFFTPPRVAYAAQEARLFSDTLRDNILLGVAATLEAVDLAVHRAVLDQDLGEMEKGLETEVGPRGVRLSGGQKQRAAAARMFVREPELYVFDDLSSALDVETEQLLWQRLFAHQQATCLVVSHRRTVLRHAGQIVLMDQGRVVASGPLAVLLETSPLMRELWRQGAQ